MEEVNRDDKIRYIRSMLRELRDMVSEDEPMLADLIDVARTLASERLRAGRETPVSVYPIVGTKLQ